MFNPYNVLWHSADLAANVINWNINEEQLQEIYNTLYHCIECEATIYLMGNGGSAAIANHFETDLLKGVRTSTWVRPKVRSLSSNPTILTAIGNDIGFDEIYSYQLQSLVKDDDVIILISSSGNSPNMKSVVETHRKGTIVAITGFDPNNYLNTSDKVKHKIHIPVNNYGVVEDVSSMVMHSLSQTLRKEFAMYPDETKSFTF
jgi:D-sedoheptulose 7-phosphate isomerase